MPNIRMAAMKRLASLAELMGFVQEETIKNSDTAAVDKEQFNSMCK